MLGCGGLLFLWFWFVWCFFFRVVGVAECLGGFCFEVVWGVCGFFVLCLLGLCWLFGFWVVLFFFV